jgi:hypothetical protein
MAPMAPPTIAPTGGPPSPEGDWSAGDFRLVTGAVVGKTTGVLARLKQYLFEPLITQFASVEIDTRGIVCVREAFESIGKVADS